jgi:hypothetical protein
MAVGDVKSGLQSIAAGAVLDIQPPAGEEWVVHNVYREESIDLQFFDGTNTLTFAAAMIGTGLIANLQCHVTNTRRLRVKNNAGTAKLVGFCGVQTR